MDDLNTNYECLEIPDSYATKYKTNPYNTKDNYIALLEKRILNLVPDHPLPVREEHFFTIQSDFNISNSGVKKITELQANLERLKTKCAEVENENRLLSKKLVNASNTQNVDKKQVPVTSSKLKFIVKNKQNNDDFFPKLEQITKDVNTELSQYYSSLYNAYSSLKEEKEKVFSSLKKEIITNEEQKNYIEVLKETIESNILKHGLTSTLNLQKTYYKETNCSNVDIMVDINRLIKEAEKFRKENILSEVKINELKQEIDYLNKSNEEYEIKLQRLKEIADNYNFELTEAKNNLYLIDKEKLDIEKFTKSIQLNNEKLSSQTNNDMDKIRQLEKENYELQKKINSVASKVEDQKALNENNDKLKSDLKNTTEELIIFKVEKNNLDSKISHQQRETKDLKEEIKRKEEVLKKIKEEYNKSIDVKSEEIDKLNKKILKLSKSISELELNLSEKEKEIRKNNDTLLINERTISSMNDKINYLEKEDKRQVLEYENKIAKIELSLKENQNFHTDSLRENEKLNLENEKLKTNLSIKDSEVKQSREEIIYLNREINNRNENINELNRIIKNADLQIQSFEIENDKLKKELKLIREKYEKEICYKTDEISNLIKQNSDFKLQISNMHCFINDKETQISYLTDDKA